jgi:hypothetical protein
LSFINIVEAICFPGERYNPSLADFQFHAVSCTPSFYVFDIGLQQIAVIGRIDSSEDIDIISK